ncbi:RNA polymerase I-specific transcription initiation factor-domain-containing protein [Jackrogersella minutella]|nr:RNA polymerase I-specific transcription initiation factor-domain-containing protein [Jackrogersella minutella]
MASAADESDEDMVPSSGSHNSFDDDDDERPNRWRGPESTWRQLNSEEIDTLTALKEIHDKDLSVHLYNTFALKQRHRRAKDGLTVDEPKAGKDFDAATGQLVQSDDWLPQRSWTAWPMRANKVPPPQDSARSLLNDPDERYTLRKPVREMPSTVLEEIIGAGILKAAKEKFNARPWVKPSTSDEEADEEESEDEDADEDDHEQWDGETVGSASASSRSKSKSRSRSRPKSVKRENASGDEMMDIDEPKTGDELEEKKLKKPHLKLAISTDDDLSYNILRPSVRHILSDLDAILTVLHNVQESTLNYQSDSGDSDASDSSRHSGRKSISRQVSQTPTSHIKKGGRPPGPSSRTRSRGRLRKRETPGPSGEDPLSNEDIGNEVRKRPPGRPKKTYPRLDGETDREYAIRCARLRKQALPVFSDEELGPGSNVDELGRESGNSGDGEETAGPSRGRPRRRKRKIEKVIRSPSRASSISTASKQRSQKPAPSKPRLGLRDWRDVLGAAALAGFPAAALDRAARRCADLFGQSMTLHTLVEGPAPPARKGLPGTTTTYVPGMAYPPLLEENEEEEGEDGRQIQMPMRGRATSVLPGAATSDDEPGASSRGRSRARSSRSRSRSAAPGSFVCSFRDCPRAGGGEGFARRTNLLRHLKLVHGWLGEAAVFEADEVDSEDEMFGAVHVDGFLKPVRMRPGWRAGDVADEPRKRRGGYGRGRGKSRGRGDGGSDADDDDDDGNDGDGDTRMGGASE